MTEKKKEDQIFRCGACGAKVPYGTHCSKVPNGDLSRDQAHQAFASQHGYLYMEEDKYQEPKKAVEPKPVTNWRGVTKRNSNSASTQPSRK